MKNSADLVNRFVERMNKGNINLGEMEQDLDINIKEGVLSWKQNNRSNFFLALVEGKISKGDKSNFSQNGIYKALIKVNNGEIRLRK